MKAKFEAITGLVLGLTKKSFNSMHVTVLRHYLQRRELLVNFRLDGNA